MKMIACVSREQHCLANTFGKGLENQDYSTGMSWTGQSVSAKKEILES